jgi:glyoxylase-like metal-dependent hydrolase (beta-lactamase superfamily II)/ferredoxin
MADPRKRLPSNVSGDFFVDSTCINCDTCRQLAPKTFGEADGYSMVRIQPADAREARDAVRALLCCPTGSIGTEGPNLAKEVIDDFPLRLDGDVFYAGFNSAKSYGGNSYLVQHAEGNWLVDSPKYLPHLVKKIEALGGLKYIFLTHRDDVADAQQYAQHFGAERIIHRLDVSSQPDAEIVVEGIETIDFAPDFRIIPSPGHTAGHCVLLYKNRYLFTGDHLAWERDERRLDAWPDYAWYSWDLQLDSLKKLLDFEFEWVLPGHGERVHLPKHEMHSQMQKLIDMFE